MISNIQALRAYAASGVLLYHTAYPLLPGNHTDFQGVSIFFVVSGFIMTHITLKDDRESRPFSFLLHRVVRIVPLYWLCTLYLGTLNLYSGLRLMENPELAAMTAGLTSLDRIVAADAFWSQTIQLMKSLLFIPYINHQGNPHPLLAVGWTLNMEMHFYLCYALMLNFKKTLAPGLTFIFLIGFIAFAQSGVGSSPLFTLHASGYPVYFCLGILVYYLWKWLDRKDLFKWKRSAITVAFFGGALYLLANLFPEHSGAFIQVGPVILVMSALVLHSCQWRVKSPFLMLLGASSYALYLTHTLVLDLAQKVEFLNFKTSLIGFSISLVVCLIFAIFVHLYLERPITGWLKRGISAQPPPGN